MHFPCFKFKSTFLFGFAIGFLAAVLLFVVQHASNNASAPLCSSSNCKIKERTDLKWFTSDTPRNGETVLRTWTKKAENNESADVTYEKWFVSQRLKINNADADAYLYGPKRTIELESDWLKSRVTVTCVVFVKKIKLARSIRNTWGNRCNKLYFFGREDDPEVPIVNPKIKLTSSWQLLCEAFNHVWKENGTSQWVIFVKDDTLVIPENLRFMLAPLNPAQDHYLGHAITLWGQSYNVADAGYVVSKSVIEKLVNKFNDSEKCAAGGKYWKQEDFYLSKHLSSMGIYPSDTRDQNLRGTFHGYSLQYLLWGIVKTGSYWTRALYPLKNECCSFMSVTFNVGEAGKLYTLDYLLYHFRVLKEAAVFGSRKAPTAVPDEDVWKIALEEEFNITNLDNISSNAYYEIWHSKYSEPSQLIRSNRWTGRRDRFN